MSKDRENPVEGSATGNGVQDGSRASGKIPPLDAETVEKITRMRSAIRENFGKVVMTLMMVPRYRTQTLSDLNHLVLEPILHDRIAIAYPGKPGGSTTEGIAATDMSGFAIWASVSEEVDAKIREQISNGVFPIRLKSDEWNSGKINWLLDVIAQDQKTIASVIANFRKVAAEGDLRLHPLISRMVDPETLQKMGARKAPDAAGGGGAGTV